MSVIEQLTGLEREQEAGRRILNNLQDHQMSVLHEQGQYRHLRFAAPDTIFYHFEIVTWPQYLALNGDLESGYTFKRIGDMIHFFAGENINPHYWEEKLAGQVSVRSYSEQILHQRVQQAFADSDRPDVDRIRQRWEEISQYRDLSDEQQARAALSSLDDFFSDSWEWDLGDYDWGFLYCCHALQFGCNMYLESLK